VQKLRVDDVVFTGPVANENMKNAYTTADIVVLTSEFEPFGYCLLEAMCLKKPTVAFSIGGIPEIIENGKSGYVVPFGDITGFAEKVALLIEDKALREKMGKRAIRIIDEKFLMEKNSKKLLDLYEMLM